MAANRSKALKRADDRRLFAGTRQQGVIILASKGFNGVATTGHYEMRNIGRNVWDATDHGTRDRRIVTDLGPSNRALKRAAREARKSA